MTRRPKIVRRYGRSRPGIGRAHSRHRDAERARPRAKTLVRAARLRPRGKSRVLLPQWIRRQGALLHLRFHTPSKFGRPAGVWATSFAIGSFTPEAEAMLADLVQKAVA